MLLQRRGLSRNTTLTCQALIGPEQPWIMWLVLIGPWEVCMWRGQFYWLILERVCMFGHDRCMYVRRRFACHNHSFLYTPLTALTPNDHVTRCSLMFLFYLLQDINCIHPSCDGVLFCRGVNMSRRRIFFLNLEDINPFCRATDTPVLYFWWHIPWVSKPGWISCLCTIPQINLWCNTCWLCGGQHGNWAFLIHVPADTSASIGKGSGLKPTTVRAAWRCKPLTAKRSVTQARA